MTTPCGICGRAFKNVRLHVVKSHEDIVLVRNLAIDENRFEYILFANRRCDYIGGKFPSEATHHEEMFRFEDFLRDQTGYDGIGVSYRAGPGWDGVTVVERTYYWNFVKENPVVKLDIAAARYRSVWPTQ